MKPKIGQLLRFVDKYDFADYQLLRVLDVYQNYITCLILYPTDLAGVGSKCYRKFHYDSFPFQKCVEEATEIDWILYT